MQQASGVADFIMQSNNSSHLVPAINDSVVTCISRIEREQFTGKIRIVEDWNRVYYYNQPDEISQTNFVRNNLNWDNIGFFDYIGGC